MVNGRKAVAGVLLACVLTGCTQLPPETTVATVPQTVATEPSMFVTEPAAPETTAQAPTEQPVPEADAFVRVLDYVPNARQDLRYATADNFTGQVIYDFQDAYLRYGTVCKLTEAARELEEMGLGILIWDAFRPVSAQARMFEAYPDPAYVSKPGVGRQNHCRGLAIDLTLYDLESGEPLAMPTGFDDFSSLADRDYSDISGEAAANAKLLEELLERHGFRGYRGEWWHFNDTDEYPIEEAFDPANT